MVSPTTTALPSVALALKLTRTVGMVLLVTAAFSETPGAAGAVRSRATLWAVEIACRLDAEPIAVDASAMVLCAWVCAAAETVVPVKAELTTELTVFESARLTEPPVAAAVVICWARVLMTLPATVLAAAAPASAEAVLLARATIVATCAAAFCAVTSPEAIGS